MEPRIVGLYTADHGGEPMESHDSVELEAGVGIIGDRYATKLGVWSDPKWPDQELTFVEAEVAEELGIEPGNLRRNIITREVRLDELIGVTFELGEALIVGVRPCTPCQYIEIRNERPGLLKAFARNGGLRAHIVRGGKISVGDQIRVVSQPAPVTKVINGGS